MSTAGELSPDMTTCTTRQERSTQRRIDTYVQGFTQPIPGIEKPRAVSEFGGVGVARN